MFCGIKPVGLPQCDSPTPHAHTNTSQYIFRIYRISSNYEYHELRIYKKTAAGKPTAV